MEWTEGKCDYESVSKLIIFCNVNSVCPFCLNIHVVAWLEMKTRETGIPVIIWGISNFTPHFIMIIITYPCWNWSWFMLVKGAFDVSKMNGLYVAWLCKLTTCGIEIFSSSIAIFLNSIWISLSYGDIFDVFQLLNLDTFWSCVCLLHKFGFTECSLSHNSWWRHQMETFSALLATCAGNSPVPGEFPTQRPVTRSFDVYFDLRPNKRLSKQSWGWWFETQSCSLWRHRNAYQGSYSGAPFTNMV